ncbi:MAG: hypothetical protein GY953_40030 [bacterium]|nr:hypothetical protein [bacterium]
MNVVVGSGLAVFVVVAAFAFLAWKLVSSTRIRGLDPDWLKKFSVESYRPMERLLSEEDFRFLRTQAGYELKVEKQLRAERRKIFRAYLQNLGRDFNRLHLALRLVILHSPEDRPDLAAALIRQRLRFFLGLAMAHVRLTMHALGVGTVDVRGLVSTLDTMRLDLRNLVAVPQPSA